MTDPTPYAITRRESIYLDFVRALAAFFVVLDHAPTLFDLPNGPRWGHQAVVVFFVLSGYVICNVADTRETDGRTFLVARLARLWSVLVPAMVLTVVCDVAGRYWGPNPWAYADIHDNAPLIRVGAVLGFLSESWVSIQPLSNGVIWSLCNEFWYYVLFAAWTFVPPGKARIAALTVAAALSGHKALLLLPVWLMGVALQRSRKLRGLSFATGTLLWCVSLAVIAWVLLAHIYGPAIIAMNAVVNPWVMTQLAQARVFWLDWLVGLVIAAHLVGARSLSARLPLERVARPVRWCAGISFAAYLFHMPLLYLCAAFLSKESGVLAIVITLATIAAIGPRIERSKGWWRRMLGRFLIDVSINCTKQSDLITNRRGTDAAATQSPKSLLRR